MEQNKTTYRKHTFITIFICFLISILEGIDLQAAGVAAAGIRADFGLDSQKLGWFFSAAMLGLLPGGIIGGRLADKLGRKKVMLVSVTVFAIFSIVTTQLSTYPWLLLARFLTGLGLGATLPNLVALVAEAASESQRGRAIALMFCGMPLGGTLISLIASTSIAADWRVIFYIGGILPLMAIPFMLFCLPESREYLQLQQQKHARSPSKLSDLLNDKYRLSTITLCIGFFFTAMVVYMLLNWLPSLLMQLGFNKAHANLIQMFFAVGSILGTVIFGYLLDRLSMKYVVVLMYSGTVLGLFALNAFASLYTMCFAALITGFFTIAGQMVLLALASLVYPTEIRGTGVGTAMTIARLGGVVGPIIAGQFLVMGGAATAVISSAIPCIMIAAVLILNMLHHQQKTSMTV